MNKSGKKRAATRGEWGESAIPMGKKAKANSRNKT